MSLSVRTDLAKFNAIPSRMVAGQKWMGNQAMLEMQPFVPRREGNLRSSVTLSTDGKRITWHTPYAHAQFVGLVMNKYRIHNYTEPGTGRRWDLRLKGNSQKMKAVKHAFVGGAGFNGPNR